MNKVFSAASFAKTNSAHTCDGVLPIFHADVFLYSGKSSARLDAAYRTDITCRIGDTEASGPSPFSKRNRTILLIGKAGADTITGNRNTTTKDFDWRIAA